MQTYVATVRILVAAPSPTDACDAISAALNDPVHTAFVDWAYLPTTNGNGVTYPEPTPDIDLDSYIEGSFLTDTPT
jgi:hypothetical protein